MATESFAERLRQAREAAGLSQYALAKACGLSKQTMSSLEAGTNQPSWATVQVIAKALGLSCEAFADDSIEMPTKDKATTGKRGRPRKQLDPPAPEVKPKKTPRKKGGEG